MTFTCESKQRCSMLFFSTIEILYARMLFNFMAFITFPFVNSHQPIVTFNWLNASSELMYSTSGMMTEDTDTSRWKDRHRLLHHLLLHLPGTSSPSTANRIQCLSLMDISSRNREMSMQQTWSTKPNKVTQQHPQVGRSNF